MEQKPDNNQISTTTQPESDFFTLVGISVSNFFVSIGNHYKTFQQYLALLIYARQNKRPTISAKVVECPVVGDSANYLSKNGSRSKT